MKPLTLRRTGMVLLGLSVALAIFQLTMFDHAIATSGAGFTDNVANDLTIFTSLIDNTIGTVIVLSALLGLCLTFTRPKMVPLRVLLAIVIIGIAFIAFELAEVAIQQHVSGFKGV